jgi:hypothetical protein
MASGLTTALAALVATLLVWLVWRARAAAVRRDEVRRALEAMSADGSGLLSAILVSLESHRRSEPVRAPEPEIEIATEAARALARLVEGARAYALAPHERLDRAEGLVRVAVAIARSRGRRVHLRGLGTELRTHADADTTCRAVLALIDALHPGDALATGHVELSLQPDDVRFVGTDVELEPGVLAAVAPCGWGLRPRGPGVWALAMRSDALGPPQDESAHDVIPATPR